MPFYWIKTHFLIKRFFSSYVWNVPNVDQKTYLTFDDGPTPEVTPWVLDTLERNNIKATFFCLGKNIQQHPELFQEILLKGHTVGNHTFDHLNGWKTDCKPYIENVLQCEAIIKKQSNSMTSIFRPPYGKIKRSQKLKIQQLGYKIIMWDVLSADFDVSITPEKCLQNVMENTSSGSIIVFHDSVKASHNLKNTLPKAIALLKEKGYIFEQL